ncbi:hypothetical protein DAPPUDRAFT_344781 [Daphnia pulex]|uniref:Uncharacterized protein n=1 Tax=Daphnia pulex TaxID=6669 RepID=E9I731_DAPPU|nr:hypothetical protein DAPPUDRAFT_344781 [Daphnia pulex]|eukprot:EFX60199.1 hypothetical protein DAPPUDRAFT_344781 [Daphnia pulex]
MNSIIELQTWPCTWPTECWSSDHWGGKGDTVASIQYYYESIGTGLLVPRVDEESPPDPSPSDAAGTYKICDRCRYHELNEAETTVPALKQPRNPRRDRHHDTTSHHCKGNSFSGEGQPVIGSLAAAAGGQLRGGQ